MNYKTILLLHYTNIQQKTKKTTKNKPHTVWIGHLQTVLNNDSWLIEQNKENTVTDFTFHFYPPSFMQIQYRFNKILSSCLFYDYVSSVSALMKHTKVSWYSQIFIEERAVYHRNIYLITTWHKSTWSCPCSAVCYTCHGCFMCFIWRLLAFLSSSGQTIWSEALWLLPMTWYSEDISDIFL